MPGLIITADYNAPINNPPGLTTPLYGGNSNSTSMSNALQRFIRNLTSHFLRSCGWDW